MNTSVFLLNHYIWLPCIFLPEQKPDMDYFHGFTDDEKGIIN